MNKPKKILACADIHFFNSKRFDEHRHVLDNFYDLIRKERPDIIVVVGDVVDSKSRLSPEQIALCRDFFLNLSIQAPIIVIPGNHDSTLNNKGRLDSLSPIIDSLRYEAKNTIDYLKSSGVYDIMGLKWAAWSCLDEQRNPFPIGYDKLKDDFVVGLFHGVVDGVSTNDGFKISGGMDLAEFDMCDMVILGDIHAQLSFRNGDINYTGSLIQVAVNEDPMGSCLVYELNTLGGYDVSVKRIRNDYSTINLMVGEQPLEPVLDTQRVRMRFDADRVTRSQATEAAKKMRNDLKVCVDLVPIVKKKDKSLIKIDDKSQIDSTNISDYFKEFVAKAHDRLGLMNVDTDIDKLLDYDVLFSKGDIKTFEDGDYFVYKLVLNNFLSFGPFDTVVDVGIPGLLGILGENKTGKSTLIIKSIQFALFHEIPDSATFFKMINKYNRDKPAFVEVFFVKSGKKYKIRRTLFPKKGAVEVGLSFMQLDDEESEVFDLTRESRQYTQEEIKKYLGINEMFEMLSIFSAQKKQVEFIDCKNAERLKLVNKFLGLQSFDLKESNVASSIKEKKAVYDNLSKQFDKETNISALEKDKMRYEFLLKNSIVEENRLKSDMDELDFYYKDIISAYNFNLKMSLKRIDEPILLLKKIDDLKNDESGLKAKISENIDRIVEMKSSIDGMISAFLLDYPDTVHPSKWKPEYEIVNKHKQDIAVLEHEISRYNKQLDLQLCNGCGKDFNDLDREKVRIKIVGLEGDRVSKLGVVVAAESLIDKMKGAVKVYRDSMQAVDNLENKEQDRLKNNIKDIIIEISGLQSQVQEFDKVQEAKMVVSLLKNKVDEYNQIKQLLSSETSLIQVSSNAYKSKIKEIDDRVRRYIDKVKQLEELEDELRLLRAYRKVVNKDGLPLYILKNKIDEINERVNLVVSQVFDFEIDFSIDEEKGELKMQFSYPDEPDGNDIGLASGSETFVINICIKVGLAQISNLPKIDSFFIDEGYDSLDSTTIEKLPALFHMLTSYYRNVVTISHMDNIKDMCSNQIRLKKEGQYTKIA